MRKSKASEALRNWQPPHDAVIPKAVKSTPEGQPAAAWSKAVPGQGDVQAVGRDGAEDSQCRLFLLDSWRPGVESGGLGAVRVRRSP